MAKSPSENTVNVMGFHVFFCTFAQEGIQDHKDTTGFITDSRWYLPFTEQAVIPNENTSFADGEIVFKNTVSVMVPHVFAQFWADPQHRGGYVPPPSLVRHWLRKGSVQAPVPYTK